MRRSRAVVRRPRPRRHSHTLALFKRHAGRYPLLVRREAASRIQAAFRGFVLRRLHARYRLSDGAQPSIADASPRARAARAFEHKATAFLAKLGGGVDPAVGLLLYAIVRLQAWWRGLAPRRAWRRYRAISSPLGSLAAWTIQSAYARYRIRTGRPLPSRATTRRRRRPKHAKAAATWIQRWWRRLSDVRVYVKLKRLLAFRNAGNPGQLLKTVAPGEVKLLDPAVKARVRFRLGGAWPSQWPPMIYFKIYVGGPVADVNAFAPRDYAAEVAGVGHAWTAHEAVSPGGGAASLPPLARLPFGAPATAPGRGVAGKYRGAPAGGSVGGGGGGGGPAAVPRLAVVGGVRVGSRLFASTPLAVGALAGGALGQPAPPLAAVTTAVKAVPGRPASRVHPFSRTLTPDLASVAPGSRGTSGAGTTAAPAAVVLFGTTMDQLDLACAAHAAGGAGASVLRSPPRGASSSSSSSATSQALTAPSTAAATATPGAASGLIFGSPLSKGHAAAQARGAASKAAVRRGSLGGDGSLASLGSGAGSVLGPSASTASSVFSASGGGGRGRPGPWDDPLAGLLHEDEGSSTGIGVGLGGLGGGGSVLSIAGSVASVGSMTRHLAASAGAGRGTLSTRASAASAGGASVASGGSLASSSTLGPAPPVVVPPSALVSADALLPINWYRRDDDALNGWRPISLEAVVEADEDPSARLRRKLRETYVTPKDAGASNPRAALVRSRRAKRRWLAQLYAAGLAGGEGGGEAGPGAGPGAAGPPPQPVSAGSVAGFATAGPGNPGSGSLPPSRAQPVRGGGPVPQVQQRPRVAVPPSPASSTASAHPIPAAAAGPGLGLRASLSRLSVGSGASEEASLYTAGSEASDEDDWAEDEEEAGVAAPAAAEGDRRAQGQAPSPPRSPSPPTSPLRPGTSASATAHSPPATPGAGPLTALTASVLSFAHTAPWTAGVALSHSEVLASLGPAFSKAPTLIAPPVVSRRGRTTLHDAVDVLTRAENTLYGDVLAPVTEPVPSRGGSGRVTAATPSLLASRGGSSSSSATRAPSASSAATTSTLRGLLPRSAAAALDVDAYRRAWRTAAASGWGDAAPSGFASASATAWGAAAALSGGASGRGGSGSWRK